MEPQVKDELVAFITAMQACNDKIRELARMEMQQVEQLGEMNEAVAKRELVHKDQIAGEYVQVKDAKGALKPAPHFKNEEQREIELQKRLALDVEYRAVKDRRRDIGRALGNSKIEREYKERQLKIWRSLVGIGGI